MRLYLVRHGETKHNADRRIQGPLLDDPLNDRGVAQARRLEDRFAKHALDGLRFAAVYASPLKRAWMTAEHVARGAGAPTPVRNDGLIEFSWGVYLGKTETDGTREAMEALHRQWRMGLHDAAPPEGESPLSAWNRAWRELEPIVARHKDETVAWVAHGRIFKILLARMVAADLSRMEDFPQGNTAVTILEHDARPPWDRNWRVVLLNDQSHLQPGDVAPALSTGRDPLV